MANIGILRSAIRLFVVLGLLTGVAAHATEWPKSDIPPDPAVTFGTLPNGMRYAIMRNATPSEQISIRFRIAAGSMQEKAAQRGLAHFLEHMAFRGSAHLADGEICKATVAGHERCVRWSRKEWRFFYEDTPQTSACRFDDIDEWWIAAVDHPSKGRFSKQAGQM